MKGKLHAKADVFVSWIERMPGAVQATLWTALGAALVAARNFIMSDVWLFLTGVVAGGALMLPGWYLIARGLNALHRWRTLRGLGECLKELRALRRDLSDFNVEPESERDPKVWKDLHLRIWEAGSTLDEYGVNCPNADRPDFRQWESYLATLTYHIRRENYKLIQQLHNKHTPTPIDTPENP